MVSAETWRTVPRKATRNTNTIMTFYQDKVLMPHILQSIELALVSTFSSRADKIDQYFLSEVLTIRTDLCTVYIQYRKGQSEGYSVLILSRSMYYNPGTYYKQVPLYNMQFMPICINI